MKSHLIKLLFLNFSLLFSLMHLIASAQPSPERLADQIAQKNSERIANIDNIMITVSPENGGFFPETTTSYEKVNRNGRDVLVAEDADLDLGILSGSFDDQMPRLIRAAHTITSESLDGRPVFKVEVDDTDALNDLGSDEDFGFEDDEVVVINAIVWIDQAELYPLKIEMGQISEEGFEISVTITMGDYREYHGLTIPHRISMNIDGLDGQFSDEDMVMAREYMRELEEQLAELPVQQREMLEEQLRPQLEMFEAMLAGEGLGMGEMVFMVTDVQVNR